MQSVERDVADEWRVGPYRPGRRRRCHASLRRCRSHHLRHGRSLYVGKTLASFFFWALRDDVSFSFHLWGNIAISQ